MKRLQTRMLLLILLPTLIFFAGLGLYISYTVHKMATDEAELMLETNGELLAEELRAELERPNVAVRTVSHSIEGLMASGSALSREQANEMLKQLLANDQNILTAWMLWNENAFDGQDAEYVNTEGHDQSGRFLPVWSKDESGNFMVEPVAGYDQPGELKDNFDQVFQTGESVMFEPFTYSVNGKDIPMTSIVSPITIDGKTVGMTGVDISLETLDAKISSITFYNSGFAGLLSNDGRVIAHQDSALIGTDYFESAAMKDREDVQEIQQSISTGQQKRIIGYSNLLKTDVYRLFTPIKIDGIQTSWSAFLTASLDEVKKEANEITKTILVINFILIIVLAIILLLVSRNITQILRTAVSHGQIMADGDFTQQIEKKYLRRKDELGELARIFNSLSEKTRELIGQVKHGTHEVALAAATADRQTHESNRAVLEVTASIEKVAHSAEIQMQSAEESAKAMGDMAHGIQTVAHSAGTVSDAASEMKEHAQLGQTVVQNAVVQMDVIQQGTNETKTIIKQLEGEAEQIQAIVSVITSISEQTNLLALNAAIEAARAGESGKGFAVVADEVRKLADETNGSAGTIQNLISLIQTGTLRASDSMAANEAGVQEGIQRMEEVRTAFQQILSSVELIVKEALELSSVAEEMSAGSEEIAATSDEMASSAEEAYEQTHQVAAASQQQLASIEEIAKSSETLKQLADELDESLKKFRV